MLTKVEEAELCGAVIKFVLKAKSSGDRAREDAIVIEFPADVELAGVEIGKALFAIESERALVARINAEQQPVIARRRGDGAIHQRRAQPGTVKARQRIDALQLDIALARRGPIGRADQRKAPRRAPGLPFAKPISAAPQVGNKCVRQ